MSMLSFVEYLHLDETCMESRFGCDKRWHNASIAPLWRL